MEMGSSAICRPERTYVPGHGLGNGIVMEDDAGISTSRHLKVVDLTGWKDITSGLKSRTIQRLDVVR